MGDKEQIDQKIIILPEEIPLPNQNEKEEFFQ